MGGRPPPPSSAFYKTLIEQSEHPSAPVKFSTTHHVTKQSHSHSPTSTTSVHGTGSMVQHSSRKPPSLMPKQVHHIQSPTQSACTTSQLLQNKPQPRENKSTNLASTSNQPITKPLPPSMVVHHPHYPHSVSQTTAPHSVAHGNSSSSKPTVEESVVEFLQQKNQSCTTTSIKMAVNVETKKALNQILYKLQRQGLIKKVKDIPPMWQLSQTTNAIHPKITTTKSPQPAMKTTQSKITTTTQQQQQHPLSSAVAKDFFETSFASLNKNPVSALNNYAQKHKSEATFEVVAQKKFGKPSVTMRAVIGGHKFPEVTAGNAKEAKRQAADIALREIGQVPTYEGHVTKDGACASSNFTNLPPLPSNKTWTHFDHIAAKSHQLYTSIALTVSAAFAGRKVVACMVMKTSDNQDGHVVSLGTGNRCITGQRISLEGKKVNDSHAEIVARRGLLRFFYKQITLCHTDKESIFMKKSNSNQLGLRTGVSFHLYISTAPCGDGALFTMRDIKAADSSDLTRDHKPTFTSKQQGILRTKIEDGEGTLPIECDAPPQTWDGLLQGGRLRTMSCSDKICRWNVLGLQGALLSHFVEPIYLDSLTLGYLYDHGHLSRAICCRLQHKDDLNDRLPPPYHVNHPWIGRVTAYKPPRGTEKTNNISINWTHGDPVAEVTDGRDGACLTRTNNAPTPSRLCKAALYESFQKLCQQLPDFQHLLKAESYKEAKTMNTNFSQAKQAMKNQFRSSKYSQWVSKPMEQDLFN